jgi:hypothetical protein
MKILLYQVGGFATRSSLQFTLAQTIITPNNPNVRGSIDALLHQ